MNAKKKRRLDDIMCQQTRKELMCYRWILNKMEKKEGIESDLYNRKLNNEVERETKKAKGEWMKVKCEKIEYFDKNRNIEIICRTEKQIINENYITKKKVSRRI